MSTDGKGKGGSYPNYDSRMKYELPIGYAPLGPPSDAYRDNFDRIFGPKPAPMEDPPACPVVDGCNGAHFDIADTTVHPVDGGQSVRFCVRPGSPLDVPFTIGAPEGVAYAPEPTAPAPFNAGLRGPVHYHIEFDEQGDITTVSEGCQCVD